MYETLWNILNIHVPWDKSDSLDRSRVQIAEDKINNFLGKISKNRSWSISNFDCHHFYIFLRWHDKYNLKLKSDLRIHIQSNLSSITPEHEKNSVFSNWISQWQGVRIERIYFLQVCNFIRLYFNYKQELSSPDILGIKNSLI